MSSGKVQIGGGNDPHARYVRPRMVIKVEGAGNGIKTVLSNLEDIAHDLHVDVDYPCKFFGMALGVQSRSEKQKLQKSANKNAKAITRYIINGQHQLPQLESLLTEFEKLFVCCPKCGAAESRLSVTKKETVQYDCAGCGQHADLPTKHKFVSYIAKHPPSAAVKGTVNVGATDRLMDGATSKEDADDAAPESSKDGDAGTAAAKPKKTGSKKAAAAAAAAAPAEAEVVWSTDTSAEAQRKRMEEEMAAMTVKGADAVAVKKPKGDDAAAAAAAAADTKTVESNPVEAATKLFAAYLTAPAPAAAAAAAASDEKKKPAKKASPFLHSADENVAELRRLCLVRTLDDSQRMSVAFGALLLPSAAVKDEKAAIAAFPAALVTHGPTFRKLASNKALFYQSFETLIADKPKLLGYVPHCIKSLYDADVLDEESILGWHATPKATNKAIRDKAAPFVEWLKAAEEDDE